MSETTAIYFVQWRMAGKVAPGALESVTSLKVWRLYPKTFTGDEVTCGQQKQALQSRHHGLEFRCVRATLPIEVL